ncbi:MAG: hypothetical protein ACU0BF_03885 [Paracoccaceae bacterium]
MTTSTRLGALAALMLLSACGAELPDLRPGMAASAPPPARAADPQADPQAGVLSAIADDLATPEAPDVGATTAAAAAPSASTAEPARRGLFGRLLGRSASDSAPSAEPSSAVQPLPAPEAPAPRRGIGALFGAATPVAAGGARTPPPGGGPDATDVAPGTVLPSGQVARVCDLPDGQRGTPVLQAAGFTVYDTRPGANAARVHYVTGFDDRCDRTFTAAAVVAGAPSMHEAVRYHPSNARIDRTATDRAYEALKTRVCRAPEGTPCGARIQRLELRTTFLTLYDRLAAGQSTWVEMLLHDGEVLAIARKRG